MSDGAVQREIDFPNGHGGARKGADRKRIAERPRVRHRARAGVRRE